MDSSDAERSTAPLTAPDRRRHPRYTVQVQIELHQEGDDVPMRLATTDLSRTGCYIELMMPFPVGTPLHVTLWLDESPIAIKGRVVTCHLQFGNGIVFVEFEGHAEQLLHRYIDAIANAV